ncbi:DUF4214 domain-containing protein [Rugamonas sp. A1-17]|nr:DUF4214 domain-containing protein [Rugamonas sp. A1-17]
MTTTTAASATDLQTLYVAYFNRPADPLGLQAWLNTGASVATIAAGFSGSDEYKATYAGKSPLDLVNSIYNNLFGRDAEAAGLTYWAGKLIAGTETFASIVLTIANSAQNDDLVAINNKVAAATAFTTSLDTAADIRGYDGAVANAVVKAWLATITTDASFTAGTTATALQAVADAAAQAHDGTLNTPQTFTLTASVDAGTAFTGGAGNDTFNGNATTLSALDQLDGGAGNDTLNLFSVNKDGVATSLDLSLPTSVKNIENLVVTSSTSALAGNTANVKGWTGLTNATFNVKGGGVQTVTAADTTAVTFNNTSGGVTINGASKVTVASGAEAVASGGAAAQTAGATSATAAAKAAAYVAAQTAAVTADATPANGGGSTTDLAAIKAAFAGAAGVTAADITAINATTTDQGALDAIAALVTANNAAAAAAASTAGAVTITGNAGLASATVVGGTTVDISDSGNATLATVSVDGNSGTATLTSDALTTVSLAHSTAAANIVNTTAKHTLTLGVNAVTGGAAVTDAAATTVNLSVTGAKATTASNINLTTNLATTLNVDTAAALTLTTTALAAADVLKTATVKGAGSFTADLSGVASLTSLDMSAGSGKHTVTLDGTIAAATIKGGSGVDVVTVTGALDAKSSIALGAGNDTYKFTTAAAAGAVVSGGDGTDTLGVVNGNLLDAAAAKVYTGFEVLEVAGGQGTYDMSILSLNAVTLTGTALAAGATISNATAATTVGISATASTDFTTGQVLTYALKDATGKADALNLSLNAIDGNNDGTAQGKVTVTGVTAASIETINVASNATADVADATAGTSAVAANKYINTITSLIADSATKVVVTGAASTVFTTIQSDTLTKIDASAATGNVTVTNAVLGTAGGAAVGAVTYIGGSGVDTYTATAKGDVFSGGAGADVVTLGAGKDTVALTKASDSILTLKDTSTPADGIADTATGFDTVNGFSSTNDKIDISSLNIATGSARGSITLHTASADTAAALQTVIGTGTGFFNDGVANRALSLVTGGGNSYLFIDANNDGNYTAGTDAVIKLVGVTALVLTDVAFG